MFAHGSFRGIQGYIYCVYIKDNPLPPPGLSMCFFEMCPQHPYLLLHKSTAGPSQPNIMLEEKTLFRHMLLLTVAVKMKFNLCTISIALPLKSGVYCNRISDFATWESERQANTGGSLETRDLELAAAKNLSEQQKERKDTSGRSCWFLRPLLILF